MRGSALRRQLCQTLIDGGMDGAVCERIASDDRLVAQVRAAHPFWSFPSALSFTARPLSHSQRFFWSAPGIKLFGDHPDLLIESRLTALLADAIQQQPAILSAFLMAQARSPSDRLAIASDCFRWLCIASDHLAIASDCFRWLCIASDGL